MSTSFAHSPVDAAGYSPGAVVGYWGEAGYTKWFTRDDAFDVAFRERFLDAHFAAARGELDAWAGDAEGGLALQILLDQFPRNAFRESAHAYSTDPLARRLASAAIAAGHDLEVPGALRVFFYMPFEHSEAIGDQDRALVLIEPLGEPYLGYARVHHDVIARFGRFPHRNRALGRVTTPDELAFLDAGGFSA